jgi:Flp pilus assembly protein TadG
MAAMTSAVRPARRPRRSLWACERGAELVEFALIFPTLLLVMLGIMDFGFMFQRYSIVTAAAREGARVAILPGYSNGDVQARVTQYLDAAGLTGVPPATVGSTMVPAGEGCITVRPVTVSYSYSYMFIGPIMTFFGETALGTKTLTATSAMRSEIPAETCP